MIITGISGSTRTGSFNTALLAAAERRLPKGVTLRRVSIAGIPLYDGDVEAKDGIPPIVAAFKEAIASADGLLLVTPEYNNGIPGTFKNAIDWATRPPADIPRVFGGKPVAVIGASPGGFGTILAQNAWLPVLRTLGCQLWTGGRLLVSGANKAFKDDELVDDGVAEKLQGFLRGFADFVASSAKAG